MIHSGTRLFQSSIARGRNFYQGPHEVPLPFHGCFSPLSLEDAISTSRPSASPRLSSGVSVLYRSRTQFLPHHQQAASQAQRMFQSSIARGRNFYQASQLGRISIVGFSPLSLEDAISTSGQVGLREWGLRFSPLSLEDAISTGILTANTTYTLCFSPLSLEDAISTSRRFSACRPSSAVSVLYRSRTQFLPRAPTRSSPVYPLFQSSIARGRNFYWSVRPQFQSRYRVSVLYRSRTQFLRTSYADMHICPNTVSVLYRSRTQFLRYKESNTNDLPPYCFSPLSLEDAISTCAEVRHGWPP